MSIIIKPLQMLKQFFILYFQTRLCILSLIKKTMNITPMRMLFIARLVKNHRVMHFIGIFNQIYILMPNMGNYIRLSAMECQAKEATQIMPELRSEMKFPLLTRIIPIYSNGKDIPYKTFRNL